MRFAFISILVLLVACTSPAQVAVLEANLTATTARAVALEAQFANASVIINQTSQDIRKYDQLYQYKVDELRETQLSLSATEKQLQFERLQKEKFQELYEACVAKYAPKIVPTATGYTTVPYDDLMRYSDDHVGEKVRYRGEVLQVSERSTGSYVLRVATAGSYDDVLWVEYDGPRVLEEDIVMLYGTFDGLTTYEAVLGNDITVPQITADTITVLQKAGDR